MISVLSYYLGGFAVFNIEKIACNHSSCAPLASLLIFLAQKKKWLKNKMKKNETTKILIFVLETSENWKYDV